MLRSLVSCFNPVVKISGFATVALVVSGCSNGDGDDLFSTEAAGTVDDPIIVTCADYDRYRVPSDSLDPNVQRLERIAGEYFNAEVKLDHDDQNTSGWLKIKYYDPETLAGILEKMTIKVE